MAALLQTFITQSALDGPPSPPRSEPAAVPDTAHNGLAFADIMSETETTLLAAPPPRPNANAVNGDAENQDALSQIALPMIEGPAPTAATPDMAAETDLPTGTAKTPTPDGASPTLETRRDAHVDQKTGIRPVAADGGPDTPAQARSASEGREATPGNKGTSGATGGPIISAGPSNIRQETGETPAGGPVERAPSNTEPEIIQPAASTEHQDHSAPRPAGADRSGGAAAGPPSQAALPAPADAPPQADTPTETGSLGSSSRSPAPLTGSNTSLPPPGPPPNAIPQARPEQLPDVIASIKPEAAGTKDSIVVQLDPPELGRVSIDFKFDAGGMQQITITADTPEATRQLRSLHFELVQALERQGFSGQSMTFADRDTPQDRPAAGRDASTQDTSQPNTSPSEIQTSSSPPPRPSDSANTSLNIKL